MAGFCKNNNSRHLNVKTRFIGLRNCVGIKTVTSSRKAFSTKEELDRGTIHDGRLCMEMLAGRFEGCNILDETIKYQFQN